MSTVMTDAGLAPLTPASAPARIPPAFYLIWLGQFVSMVGSQLTGFALGVWLFKRTGSVLDFSELTICATLPAVLLMPFSGSLADRWNKRHILVACEAVALACTGGMALLLWLDRFEVWQLMALQATLSVSLAFQAPAAYATISAIVPKSSFAKAGGMFQFANAIAQFSGPLLAASVLGVIGISGIVAFDTVTFAVALVALLFARFPAVSAPADPSRPRRDAIKDMEWSFNYLVERPAMAALYGYTTLASFLSGIVVVMIAPLVLVHHTEQVLAWVVTSAAFGMLASGLALMGWGGPKKFTPLMLGLAVLQGLAIATAGWYESVAALCACAFFATLCNSVLGGYMSTVWRRKVPRDRQGSFSALQQGVALALIPLSAVIGGSLAHYVFEPALMPGGFWADSVGAWFGIGRGRGTGFLFFVVGLGVAAAVLPAFFHRGLRRFDDEVSDAL
jgi:DHA3 family macrolide efflux protein-like MFS transporter